MQFDSWQAFFAMGGHGLYVWLAYGATIAVLLISYISVRSATKRTVARLEFRVAQEAAAANESNDQPENVKI